MFLHMSPILFTGEGGIPACIAGSIPVCLAAGLEGWWYPSMPCRFLGPHPGGKLRGLARGVSRPTPGRVSRPTPRGVSRPTPGGSPGPHLGGLQAHTWGVCIPACTKADPPSDCYCCGLYASYWNAFLFTKLSPESSWLNCTCMAAQDNFVFSSRKKGTSYRQEEGNINRGAAGPVTKVTTVVLCEAGAKGARRRWETLISRFTLLGAIHTQRKRIWKRRLSCDLGNWIVCFGTVKKQSYFRVRINLSSVNMVKKGPFTLTKS